MSTLRVTLLGAAEVWREEQRLTFTTRKSLALLAYLLAAGGLHSREQLAALYWPDAEPDTARSTLRSTLRFLRLTLGAEADATLSITRDAVSVALDAPFSLDLVYLARAQRLARTERCPPELRAQLERAADLYRGPFLDGLSVPDAPELEVWVSGQRAHWLGVASDVFDRLAVLQASEGDTAAALATLERWVGIDPAAEEAWQRLIATHLERGDGAAARRTWAACRAALADLGVEPDTQTLELAAQIDGISAQRLSLLRSTSAGHSAIDLGRTPLVGRGREMAALRRTLEQARQGRPSLVLLEGEAGIGKTRLAQEFLDWAGEQGADVLSGRALQTRGALPYAPLVQALRPRLEQENAPDDLLCDMWLAELGRLLPELRERYPDLSPVTGDETLGQGRLFEAVARLVVALAERAPLVLFLDDMQWADAATQDLLCYLTRRWSEAGVRVVTVLALRAEDAELDRELAHWLGGLRREVATISLRPQPLASEDVVHLVAALAGGTESEQGGIGDAKVAAFGQWLARKTAGQPCYIVQTLRALLEQGVLGLYATEAGGWALDVAGALTARAERLEDTLLAGARHLVRASLARLDETALAVLAAGAVLGGRFSAECLYHVAGVKEGVGSEILDRLVRARLLREAPDAGGYMFGHDLLRAAVYAEAGEARRQLYHRRATAAAQPSALMIPSGVQSRERSVRRHVRFSTTAGRIARSDGWPEAAGYVAATRV
jgi:DNA-binding SARP family transcriptional activator